MTATPTRTVKRRAPVGLATFARVVPAAAVSAEVTMAVLRWAVHPEAIAQFVSAGARPFIENHRAFFGFTLQRVLQPCGFGEPVAPARPQHRLIGWILQSRGSGAERKVIARWADHPSPAETGAVFCNACQLNGSCLSVDVTEVTGERILSVTWMSVSDLNGKRSERGACPGPIWAWSILPEVLGLKGGQYEPAHEGADFSAPADHLR